MGWLAIWKATRIELVNVPDNEVPFRPNDSKDSCEAKGSLRKKKG